VDAAIICVNAKIWRQFSRRCYAHFQRMLGISSHDAFLLSLRPKQPAASGNLRPWRGGGADPCRRPRPRGRAEWGLSRYSDPRTAGIARGLA
jgi:hypothetical protein